MYIHLVLLSTQLLGCLSYAAYELFRGFETQNHTIPKLSTPANGTSIISHTQHPYTSPAAAHHPTKHSAMHNVASQKLQKHKPYIETGKPTTTQTNKLQGNQTSTKQPDQQAKKQLNKQDKKSYSQLVLQAKKSDIHFNKQGKKTVKLSNEVDNKNNKKIDKDVNKKDDQLDTDVNKKDDQLDAPSDKKQSKDSEKKQRKSKDKIKIGYNKSDKKSKKQSDNKTTKTPEKKAPKRTRMLRDKLAEIPAICLPEEGTTYTYVGMFRIPTQRGLLLQVQKFYNDHTKAYHRKAMKFLRDIKEVSKFTTEVEIRCHPENQPTYKQCVKHVTTQSKLMTKDLLASMAQQQKEASVLINETTCNMTVMKADPVELIKSMAIEGVALDFAMPAFLRLIHACSMYCQSKPMALTNVKPLRSLMDRDLAVKYFLQNQHVKPPKKEKSSKTSKHKKVKT